MGLWAVVVGVLAGIAVAGLLLLQASSFFHH